MSCQGRIALEARCGTFVFLTPTASRRFKKRRPPGFLHQAGVSRSWAFRACSSALRTLAGFEPGIDVGSAAHAFVNGVDDKACAVTCVSTDKEAVATGHLEHVGAALRHANG